MQLTSPKSVLSFLKTRKQTLGYVSAVTGGQALTLALGLLGGLIQARYVLPDVLGQFGTFTILAGYLTFLHFGTLTALHREYPYWLGKGDHDRALHAAAITQGWNLVVGASVILLYVALAVWSVSHLNWTGAAGWGSQILVGASFYALYLGSTYRSMNEFVTWARISVVGAVLTFAALPLVVWLGYWGMCLRAALPGMVTLLLLHRYRPVKVRPMLQMREVWTQAKFGLPMDIGGFLANSCALSLMSTMVLWKYGERVLGLLMFAKVAEGAIQQLILSVIQVVVVRINHRMGVTEDVRHCVRFALTPMYAGLLVVIPAIVLCIVFAKFVVNIIAPSYADAVPLFRVLVIGALFSVLQLPCHALVAARRVYAVATGSVTCFVTFTLLSLVALRAGWNVNAIAIAYVSGQAASAVVSWYLLWRTMQLPARASVASSGATA